MQLVLFAVIFLLYCLVNAIKIIPEWERGVVFRLGKFANVKGPGVQFIIPFVDKLVKVNMRVVTMDVPTQEVMTRDNVPVSVNAIVLFRVVNAGDAIIKVANYRLATSLYAQTTLRSVIGRADLDEVLTEREKLNNKLQTIMDQATDPWGIKVVTVEIKDVELPATMKRAMAKQAEAERERRSIVISAQGEYQAAEKILEAAKTISANPIAVQLRFLQTLREIAVENPTTTFFPVPVDLAEPFLKRK